MVVLITVAKEDVSLELIFVVSVLIIDTFSCPVSLDDISVISLEDIVTFPIRATSEVSEDEIIVASAPGRLA